MTSAELRDVQPRRLTGARRQIGGIVGRPLRILSRSRVRSVPTARSSHASAVSWRSGTHASSTARIVHDWSAVAAGRRLADVLGPFAVAWLDDDEALHLARDAAGERSLFYVRTAGGIAFASTVRALVASGAASRAVDMDALPAYLTYGYVPGRETLVSGVREVLPGEQVSFSGGRVTARPFWTLPGEDASPRSDGEYCDELRSLLEDAVGRRLPDDGQLAATLSGGVDSSVVVALARRLYDGPLTAYSLSFGKGIPNEVAFAALVADHCGVRHEVVDLTPRSVIDRFDSTLGSLSTPIGEPLTVANALLFETIAPASPRRAERRGRRSVLRRPEEPADAPPRGLRSKARGADGGFPRTRIPREPQEVLRRVAPAARTGRRCRRSRVDDRDSRRLLVG